MTEHNNMRPMAMNEDDYLHRELCGREPNMTIEEAIAHLDESLNDQTRDWGCKECKQEHVQLRELLVELQQRRAKGGKPKPHGRLIDADALARQEAQAFKELSGNETDPWVTALFKALHRYLQSHLEQAPTVVPEVGAP